MELVRTDDKLWTAIRTKARCEKVVKAHCEHYNIPCYLPVRRRVKRYQRRTVETYLPMFPGYLFVQLDDDGRQALLLSHKVVWIAAITEPEEEKLVAELREIQHLSELAANAEIEVQPEIVPGKIVTITTGPMKGLAGIVQKRRQKTRIVLNVDILGQSAAVDLDVGELELDGD